ncbi:MAG: hypothetical protein ACOCP4_06025 [Candidatus Woesearchaeota archaeon]
MKELKIAKDFVQSSQNDEIKQKLNLLTGYCPNCQAGRDFWRIDVRGKHNPPITEMEGYDLVRYECVCGAVFKKIEEK